MSLVKDHFTRNGSKEAVFIKQKFHRFKFITVFDTKTLKNFLVYALQVTIIIHLLLFITRKYAFICVK